MLRRFVKQAAPAAPGCHRRTPIRARQVLHERADLLSIALLSTGLELASLPAPPIFDAPTAMSRA